MFDSKNKLSSNSAFKKVNILGQKSTLSPFWVNNDSLSGVLDIVGLCRQGVAWPCGHHLKNPRSSCSSALRMGGLKEKMQLMHCLTKSWRFDSQKLTFLYPFQDIFQQYCSCSVKRSVRCSFSSRSFSPNVEVELEVGLFNILSLGLSYAAIYMENQCCKCLNADQS